MFRLLQESDHINVDGVVGVNPRIARSALNMTKYGGPGKMKQCCINSHCSDETLV